MTDDTTLSKTEGLLALLVLDRLGDALQEEKAAKLSSAGLTNAEIAGLLGTSPGVIAQQLHARRKRGGRPAKKASKSGTPKQTAKRGTSKSARTTRKPRNKSAKKATRRVTKKPTRRAAVRKRR